MKTKEIKLSREMTANKLGDIVAKQLFILDSLDLNESGVKHKIDRARQVFNGAGKMISLSNYVLTAKLVSEEGYGVGIRNKAA